MGEKGKTPVKYALICALSALIVSALVLLCGPAKAEPVQPSFSPSNFTPGAPINNIYFPLVPGTTFRSSATITDPDTGEKSNEVDEDFVSFQTKQIAGVRVRVVRSRVFSDGVLAEDTNDYYAQDKSGNVWYMGEDTKAFERDDQGNIISTDTTGTWRAGVHGDVPGFIMPANPTVGFFYFQENAPQDQAQDQAKVLSLNEKVTVPAGSFSNVLETEETTPLEPGLHENKFYAPGVGPILAIEDISADFAGNRLSLESVTTSNAIPLPPAFGPGIVCVLGMFCVYAVSRRRRALRV